MYVFVCIYNQVIIISVKAQMVSGEVVAGHTECNPYCPIIQLDGKEIEVVASICENAHSEHHK